jgi:hypothetical protein
MIDVLSSVIPSGLDVLPPIPASGGGSGVAPANATYVVMSLDPTLTNERVLTAGNSITITDGGANGPVTIAIPTFTPGSFIFAGAAGQLAQDNAGAFYDDANNRAGFGIAANTSLVETVTARDNRDRAVFASDYTGSAATISAGSGFLGKLNGVDAFACGAFASTNISTGANTPPVCVLHSLIGNLSIYTDQSKDIIFSTGGVASGNERQRINSVAISASVPFLPRAGSAAAGTVPMQFTTGALLTTAVVGGVEFLTDKFYGTISSSAARKEFALWDSGGTSGRIPTVTTNGRLLDWANYLWDGVNSALGVGPSATHGLGVPFAAYASRNEFVQGRVANSSNGALAYSAWVALNDTGVGSYLVCRSSGFTTVGLSVANGTEVASTNNLLLFTINANPIIVSPGGQNNEAMRWDSSANTNIKDGKNVILGTTTGTKIGTAAAQKLSFWNATPIVQPTTAVAAATFVANTSGIVNDTATWDGYTVGKVVKALRNAGLLA